jgi:hypothetical protein
MQLDWLKPITFPNHDQIHDIESGPGYVLRMCDANLVQFCDISNLLNLTGFTYIPDNRIPEICRLFGASYAMLAPRFITQFKQRSVITTFLMGHKFQKPYLIRQRHPQVCPSCLANKRIAQVIWDITLVTACHIHGNQLIDSCAQCGRKVNWRRNSLINCQCGASLLPAHQLTTPASKAELLVSRLIWQKLFGLFEPKAHSLSFLANLEIDTSLRLIWSFGQVELDGHTVAVRPGKVPSTAAAGQVVRRGVERIYRALNHKRGNDNFSTGIYINSIKQLKEDPPWNDQLKIEHLINLIVEKDHGTSKLPSLTTHKQLILFGANKHEKKLQTTRGPTRH